MAKKVKHAKSVKHKWQIINNTEPIFFEDNEVLRRLRVENGYIYQTIFFHSHDDFYMGGFQGLALSSMVYVPDK
jgi:hypothetical protein